MSERIQLRKLSKEEALKLGFKSPQKIDSSIHGAEPQILDIYGLTGKIDKDGILTLEQQTALDSIQEQAAIACMDYLTHMQSGDKQPMVAMATGIGKGRIIHLVLEEQFKQKPESKVLVVAGTKNILVHQTHEALGRYQQADSSENSNGTEDDFVEPEDLEDVTEETEDIQENETLKDTSQFYKTGGLKETEASVQVATIQTVQSYISRGVLDPSIFDLVVVDEVHNIGTRRRLETIQQFSKCVGFTATPFRYSGVLKAPEQYGFKVVESLTLPEAQEQHFLPPLLGTQVQTKDLIDEIPTTPTGKIDFKALEKLLKDSPELRPYIADRIAPIISEGDRNYKTVVAVNFVWEAKELAELLQAKGIKVGVAVNQEAAKVIHTNQIPALDSIERYKLPLDNPDSIQVLISPYVASEGFDAPFTEILVWASPTDSFLRYTQYTGRLARRYPGKAFGLIVDCLYQTSQYSWSYNMGMWMKGEIRQLDNGLLYLGSKRDIEDLKQLPQIDTIQKQSDTEPLDNLQKINAPVLEQDFVISRDSIEAVFKRGRYNPRDLAQNIIDSFKTQPGLVMEKYYGGQLVWVVTNRALFIEAMVGQGATLKEVGLSEIQDTDFPVSTEELLRTFVGHHRYLRSQSETVLKKLKTEAPNLIVKRKSGTRTVVTVVDRGKFIGEMLMLGAKLKPKENLPEIQDSDFPLTDAELIRVFIGSHRYSRHRSDIVLKKLQAEDPNLIAKRKSGGQPVVAIVDRRRFIDEMLMLGTKLRSGN